MTSFLGVPIVSRGKVIGAFYLADKTGAAEFSREDQETIEMLAAHAAVAIENAQLYERSRELSVVEERNRLARDLHDSVVQTLFSISLTAEAASANLALDPQKARGEVENLRDLAREALQEARALVFELRPGALDSEGLVPTLQKHVDVVRRVSHKEISLSTDGYDRQSSDLEKELFRITQEALSNAVRHADAARIEIDLASGDGRVAVTVTDNGVGFDPSDPQIRTRRLGVTSMEERAEELGGSLSIQSRPGTGTRVRVEVPIV
jgi:signal transduction histidine kinase